MRFLFFIFLFIILVGVNFVSAGLSLDKGHLDFDINKNERLCQIVKISSEDYTGNISIRDIWPEEGEEGSSFNKYILTSEDYDITIEHPNKISNFNKKSEIEVCLSGERIGNFRGALIFTPEAGNEQINVVVEVGTWLMVNVSENNQQSPPSNTGTNTGRGSSSSSGGGSIPIPLIDDVVEVEQDNIIIQENKEPDEVQEQTGINSEKRAGITGAVIGGKATLTGAIILIILIIIGVIIVRRKRRNK